MGNGTCDFQGGQCFLRNCEWGAGRGRAQPRLGRSEGQGSGLLEATSEQTPGQTLLGMTAEMGGFVEGTPPRGPPFRGDPRRAEGSADGDSGSLELVLLHPEVHRPLEGAGKRRPAAPGRAAFG